MQKTIKNNIQIHGKGLHTGIFSSINIMPSKENTGITFQRIDLKNKPTITACIENVINTQRRTVIKENGASIETIEHLLAAIFASSIDNLFIEINGPEVPILDGSAKIFIEKIEQSGIVVQNAKKPEISPVGLYSVQ